ncbi:hypothetical protein Ahia01_000163300, partial [Argonauta hians]
IMPLQLNRLMCDLFPQLATKVKALEPVDLPQELNVKVFATENNNNSSNGSSTTTNNNNSSTLTTTTTTTTTTTAINNNNKSEDEEILQVLVSHLAEIIKPFIEGALQQLWPFMPPVLEPKIMFDENSYIPKLCEADILLIALSYAIECNFFHYASAIAFVVDRFMYWYGGSRLLLTIIDHILEVSPSTMIAPQLTIRRARIMKDDGNLHGAIEVLDRLINSRALEADSKDCRWRYKTELQYINVYAVCVQIKGQIYHNLGLWKEALPLLLKSVEEFERLEVFDKKGISYSYGLISCCLCKLSVDEYSILRKTYDFQSDHSCYEAFDYGLKAADLSPKQSLFFARHYLQASESLLKYAVQLPDRCQRNQALLDVVLYLRNVVFVNNLEEISKSKEQLFIFIKGLFVMALTLGCSHSSSDRHIGKHLEQACIYLYGNLSELGASRLDSKRGKDIFQQMLPGIQLLFITLDEPTSERLKHFISTFDKTDISKMMGKHENTTTHNNNNNSKEDCSENRKSGEDFRGNNQEILNENKPTSAPRTDMVEKYAGKEQIKRYMVDHNVETEDKTERKRDQCLVDYNAITKERDDKSMVDCNAITKERDDKCMVDCNAITKKRDDKSMVDCNAITKERDDKSMVDCNAITRERDDKSMVDCNAITKERDDKSMVDCNATTRERDDKSMVDCNAITRERDDKSMVDCNAITKERDDKSMVDCNATTRERGNKCIVDCNPITREKDDKSMVDCNAITKERDDKSMVDCNAITKERGNKSMVDCNTITRERDDKCMVDCNPITRERDDKCMVDCNAITKERDDKSMVDCNATTRERDDKSMVDCNAITKERDDKCMVDCNAITKERDDKSMVDCNAITRERDNKSMVDCNAITKERDDKCMVDCNPITRERDDKCMVDCNAITRERDDKSMIDCNAITRERDDKSMVDCNAITKERDDKSMVDCNATTRERDDKSMVDCNAITRERDDKSMVDCNAITKERDDKSMVDCNATTRERGNKCIVDCNPITREKDDKSMVDCNAITKERDDKCIVDCNPITREKDDKSMVDCNAITKERDDKSMVDCNAITKERDDKCMVDCNAITRERDDKSMVDCNAITKERDDKCMVDCNAITRERDNKSMVDCDATTRETDDKSMVDCDAITRETDDKCIVDHIAITKERDHKSMANNNDSSDESRKYETEVDSKTGSIESGYASLTSNSSSFQSIDQYQQLETCTKQNYRNVGLNYSDLFAQDIPNSLGREDKCKPGALLSDKKSSDKSQKLSNEKRAREHTQLVCLQDVFAGEEVSYNKDNDDILTQLMPYNKPDSVFPYNTTLESLDVTWFYTQHSPHSKQLTNRLQKSVLCNYDPMLRMWNIQDSIIYIRKELSVGKKGSFRDVYEMNFMHQDEPLGRYVCKRYRKEKDPKEYIDDVICQMEASLYVTYFNQALKSYQLDVRIYYLPAAYMKLLGVNGQVECHVNIEPFVEGEFLKLTNNYDYCNPRECITSTAFTHFTYSKSDGKFMVVDLQGWLPTGVQNIIYLTDPQFHTASGDSSKYDFGMEGFKVFFSKVHPECNRICQILKLQRPKF